MSRALSIATSWLSALESSLKNNDIDAFLGCLEPQSWLRDLLIFSPNLQSRHGHSEIRNYLTNTFSQAGLSGFKIDKSQYGSPKETEFSPGRPIIELSFDFETPLGLGKGVARINIPENGGTPQAMAVLFMLSDWKAFREISNESGVYDGHNLSWKEVREKQVEEIEKDPHVIIVGSAQSGLQVAARFRQMGIKTLVIEQTTRIGDVWRNRYPTLALHTPRSHHSFLYQPFPSNWPTFTSRDKLADWLEQYATMQDLVVWTSANLEPTPAYNTKTQQWNVTVNRNGSLITLHPRHLVMATSIFGDMRIPSLPGRDEFNGSIIHSSSFAGGQGYTGKRVLVVGAGNSSVDICQDLVFRGAQSVTMLQRSTTAVVSDKYLAATFGNAFPEGKPTYYSDLSFAGLPIGLLEEFGKSVQPFQEEVDKELLSGLTNAGFNVKSGPDFSGQLLMVFSRGGGYFIDVGCGALIANGKVEIKQGVEIDHLKSNAVGFNDGTSIEVDDIILATGWHPVRDRLRRLFGDEVINRTSELWGSDEYGEIRAGYKPSGQPGLWFAVGDFAISRFYSKLLALQIKGLELGLLSSAKEQSLA